MRFNSERDALLTGTVLRDMQRLADMAVPQYVDVADTGPADTVKAVRHTLGRVPRGVRIANMEVPGTTPVAWYRTAADPEWTRSEVFLKFTVANSHILLEIF